MVKVGKTVKNRVLRNKVISYHIFLAEVLKARIALLARSHNMPGFPRSGHIL